MRLCILSVPVHMLVVVRRLRWFHTVLLRRGGRHVYSGSCRGRNRRRGCVCAGGRRSDLLASTSLARRASCVTAPCDAVSACTREVSDVTGWAAQGSGAVPRCAYYSCDYAWGDGQAARKWQAASAVSDARNWGARRAGLRTTAAVNGQLCTVRRARELCHGVGWSRQWDRMQPWAG